MVVKNQVDLYQGFPPIAGRFELGAEDPDEDGRDDEPNGGLNPSLVYV